MPVAPRLPGTALVLLGALAVGCGAVSPEPGRSAPTSSTSPTSSPPSSPTPARTGNAVRAARHR